MSKITGDPFGNITITDDRGVTRYFVTIRDTRHEVSKETFMKRLSRGAQVLEAACS